jgi:hypothetical protein
MPVIKWAPHNMLAYSEDVSQSGTYVDFGSTGFVTFVDEETITFDAQTSAQAANTTASTSSLVGQTLTGVVELSSQTDAGEDVRVKLNWRGGASYEETYTLTTTPTLVAVTQEVPSGTTGVDLIISNAGSGTAKTFTASKWHLYRSDLGGMVDNPERGDSYVPTALRPFGPNLISNGTFDTDTTGWTGALGASLSVVNGALRVAEDGNDASTARAYQSFSTVVGKPYEVKVDYVGGTGGSGEVYINNNTNFGGALVSDSSIVAGTTATLSFVATATTTYILLGAGPASEYNDYDNISVRESSVNPSAARYLPRIGHHVYNGSAWVNEGVLAESESRTNALTYSNELTNAAWIKSVSIAEVDDKYGFTLFRTYQAGTGSFTNIQQAGPTVPNDGYVTLSAYVKGGTSPQTAIRIQETANTERCTQPINWTNGVPSFDTVSNTTDLQLYNRTIQDVGDGLYRVSITAQNTTGASIGTVMYHYNQWNGTSNSPDSYVGAMQAELGATPSSFIPTIGSTVTRAAETFTIPSANLPWPEPQYIGDNAVTNGTFDTDSDWTKGAGWTISGGVASIVNPATSSTYIQQALPSITQGAVYEVSVDIASLGTGVLEVRLGSNATDGGVLDFASTGTQLKAVGSWTGNGTTLFIRGTSTSGTYTFDNISVREVNPLAVSIGMEGRITYADNGTYDEATFVRWRADADNYIETDLSTNSTDTGRFFFKQEEGTVYDFVSSATTLYSPDVLVPFNFAQRNGSTFVNGAADGVALTADTTPTALPDLSSTDLNLAYGYMGTISEFRVWDKDITDDGLVEATNPELEPSLSLEFSGSGTNSYVINDWSE